jgi:hypothetical protein
MPRLLACALAAPPSTLAAMPRARGSRTSKPKSDGERRDQRREREAEREQAARLRQEQLEQRRSEVAIVERNLAIVGLVVAVGSFYNFALFAVVAREAVTLDQLIDFTRFMGPAALSFFLAGAVRIFAGMTLWWADRLGRTLHLIGVGATVIGSLLVFVSNPLGAQAYLLNLIPAIAILSLLWTGPIAKLFTDAEFQAEVKPNTRSQRPYDAVFWAALVIVLLFGGGGIALMRMIMT